MPSRTIIQGGTIVSPDGTFEASLIIEGDKVAGVVASAAPGPDDEVIDTVAVTAEGSRISSLARVKGHKEDTIIDWIRDAADHAEAIEEVLLAEYQISRGQLDGLWAYVRNKGERKVTRKPTQAANSGAPR